MSINENIGGLHINRSATSSTKGYILATGQGTRLTIWRGFGTSPPEVSPLSEDYSSVSNSARIGAVSTEHNKAPKKFQNGYLPILTLNLGFKILRLEFSSRATLLACMGEGSKVFVWKDDFSNFDKLLSSTTLSATHRDFQNLVTSNASRADPDLNSPYQHYHNHQTLTLPELKLIVDKMHEGTGFEPIKIYDMNDLIKGQPGQPALPRNPKFDFSRFLDKDKKQVLVLGGSGLRALYQLNLKDGRLLGAFDMETDEEIVGMALNSDSSLGAAITRSNLLILVHRTFETRQVIELLHNDVPTHISFSNFEQWQMAVSYESGALALYDCRLPSHSSLEPSHVIKENLQSPISALVHWPLNRYLLAIATSNGNLIIYDVVKNKIAQSIKTSVPIYSIAFRPDCTAFMLGSSQGELLSYNMRQSDKPIWSVAPEASGDSVLTVAFQSIPNLEITSKLHKRSMTTTSGILRARSNSNTKLPRPASLGLDFNYDSSFPISESPSQREIPEPSFINIFSPLKRFQRDFRQTSPQNNSVDNHSDPVPSISPPKLASGTRDESNTFSKNEKSSLASPNLSGREPGANLRDRSYTLPGKEASIPASPNPNARESGARPRSLTHMESLTRSFSETPFNRPTQTQAEPPREPPTPKTPSVPSLSSYTPHLEANNQRTHLTSSPANENQSNLPVKLFQTAVEDSLHTVQVDLKRDIHAVHVELLDQIRILKSEMVDMFKGFSRVPQLLERIEALEEENRRLKLDY